MILVQTQLDMLSEISRTLTTGDLAEFHKMIEGRRVTSVLLGSLNETSMSIIHNGKVLATGGSNECLWFVTSKYVDVLTARERLQMLNLLKDHLETCRARMAPELMSNLVWVGNEQHIRLLEHLGARFADHTVTSPAGFPFRQFWL
jgi:hypothetical protein